MTSSKVPLKESLGTLKINKMKAKLDRTKSPGFARDEPLEMMSKIPQPVLCIHLCFNFSALYV